MFEQLITHYITLYMADGSVVTYDLTDPKQPLPSFRSLVVQPRETHHGARGAKVSASRKRELTAGERRGILCAVDQGTTLVEQRSFSSKP